MAAQAARRLLQEWPARHGQPANDEIAVILREARGRAAGRVIATLALALEEDYGGKGCDLVGCSGARDTAAHHEDVRGRDSGGAARSMGGFGFFGQDAGYAA